MKEGFRRRALDLACALVGLFLIAPVMVLIGTALLLEGGRPVFFRQTRLGLGGRPFGILKFRKFAPDEGANGSPLTVCGDTRMTRVGRFLAATKLDELPQFINVVRGEMAIIGPRPESLAFADCFEGQFGDLLNHKPGIFGPAQALFRDEASCYPADAVPTAYYRGVLFPLKAELDLTYYARRTVLSDLSWLLRCGLAIAGFPMLARSAEVTTMRTSRDLLFAEFASKPDRL